VARRVSRSPGWLRCHATPARYCCLPPRPPLSQAWVSHTVDVEAYTNEAQTPMRSRTTGALLPSVKGMSHPSSSLWEWTPRIGQPYRCSILGHASPFLAASTAGVAHATSAVTTAAVVVHPGLPAGALH
jgi:hypothetical protein